MVALPIIRSAFDPPAINVESQLGLVRGASAADANSVKLNAAVAAGYRLGFQFPAGDWYFGADTVNPGINGTCIQTPTKSGFSFTGSGGFRVDAPGTPFVGPNAMILYGGPRIFLQNLTHSATAETITITSGYTVKTQDVGATVHINGGTNAAFDAYHVINLYPSEARTEGWFTIVSVNTGANSWTLDRNVVSSGTSTNLTGLMTYTLWRDYGYANFYRGLAFMGNDEALFTSTRCHIGVHIPSNPGGQLNYGKHLFEQCSWNNFTACAMTGANMKKAYAEANPYEGSGSDGNHADHLTFYGCNAQHARNFLLVRAGKSVSHSIRDSVHIINIDEAVVYSERGGQITIDHMTIGGARGYVLRVGKPTSNTGFHMIRNLNYDADPNDTVPRLYRNDSLGGASDARVLFDSVFIDSGLDAWTVPLVEASEGDTVTLRNVERLLPGSVKLTDPGHGWTPSVIVDGATLEGFSSSPSELKHADSTSPSYGRLKWRDCANATHSVHYADGQIP